MEQLSGGWYRCPSCFRKVQNSFDFLSLLKQIEQDCIELDEAVESPDDDNVNEVFNRLNDNLRKLTKNLEEINEESVNVARKLTNVQEKIVKRPVTGLNEFYKIRTKFFQQTFDSSMKLDKFVSTQEIPEDLDQIIKKSGTLTSLSSSDAAIRTECPDSNLASISRTEIAIGSSAPDQTKSRKSDEKAIRTPRPMSGRRTPDISKTETNLDNDENILPVSEAALSHEGSKQMGVSFSSEIASKTATASEICERQSRKETAINSRKKNFCSQSSEIAQRTPPPEGMQDISRTERSVNEKFGSSDKSTAAGSSVKKQSKKGSRKKERTKRSKSAAGDIMKPMVSGSEIAIRTAAPMEKYEGVSRTEKRIDLGGESFSNENAIRTPPPEGQGSNMSRTEISVNDEGTAAGIRLSKKERRRRGASLYRSPTKDLSQSSDTVDLRGIEIGTVKANEIAERTPQPEGAGNISRTEPVLDDDEVSSDDKAKPSTKKKSKRIKQKRHVRRSKVKSLSRDTALKRTQDIRQPSLSSNERAVRTPNLGAKSRTELTIDLGKQRSETAKSNEMAIRTPPPGGTSSTDATVNDEPKPPQKFVGVGMKQKKDKKKSKIKRSFSDVGQKKTAATFPGLHFTKSASDRSVRSDRAIRTPPKEGGDTSITESDIDDFHERSKNMNLLSASERVYRSDRIVPTPVAKENLESKSMESLRPPIIVADQVETSSKKFVFDLYKVCETVIILLLIVCFFWLLVFHSWRLANAITAVYDVSIDDCVVANGLCHRYSMCCFSQCGATRLQIFWSKLLG